MQYRVGQIKATYAELVSAFGKPTLGPSDKVQVEWVVRGYSGPHFVEARIYDWKADGFPVDENEWSIGGTTAKAVEIVERKLAEYRANALARATALVNQLCL